jgi:hypothetical protein
MANNTILSGMAKQTYHFEAEDLVIRAPILGTPSIAVRHVCPVTGQLLETRVVADMEARARQQTTSAREEKNAKARKKLAALDALVRAAWEKNSKLEGNAHGTAMTIAGNMLTILCAIDPQRYPPIDHTDKEVMDQARERAAGWICDSLSKTAVWRERGLPL